MQVRCVCIEGRAAACLTALPIIPCSTDLLEKVAAAHVIRKITKLFGTGIYITLLTRAA